MAIRNFSLEGLRGLKRAEAHDLPNLVAIAGPNGAGKSNLLEGIRQQRGTFLEPGSELLYIGPHRTWRSSNVSRVSVYGFTADTFMDVLKADVLPSYQYAIPGNLQMLQNVPRSAGSADDAQAYIKTAMIRLFDKQRALVTETWDQQGGEVQKGTVPDLFGPFYRLVSTLLPHLEWIRVDDSQKEHIRCLFRPKNDPSLEFDIDDLSSGEKAAIALFLPFIEKQALALIGPNPQSPPAEVVPLTVLIDEPEIHLHPLLQLNVLEYMRALAREGEAQFIFTCHSPTMLDALGDDELWLLSPAALAQDNQLVRLTDNREHLQVARMLTGATHLLTRGKPIVFVEGEQDRGGAVTDERLLRLLAPATSHWAIVPTNEKQGVIEAAQRLRASELALPGQPVFGLVDSDRDDHTALPDYVISWPVAMIENLLLDPAAISQVLHGFDAVTGLRDAQQVLASLLETARERRDEEIALRIRLSLPVETLALSPADLGDPEKAVAVLAEKYMKRLEAIDLTAIAKAAEEEVDQIIAQEKMLERFHGKRLLYGFYERHRVSSAGLGKAAFATKVAEACAGSARVTELAVPALDRIRLFFPSNLSTRLRSAEIGEEHLSGQRDELARLCDEQYELWTQDAPQAEGRDELRQRVFDLAHQLAGEDRSEITVEASRIGTA